MDVRLLVLLLVLAILLGCNSTASEAVEANCAGQLPALQAQCTQAGGTFRGSTEASGLDECGASGSGAGGSGRCRIEGSGSCSVVCELPSRQPFDGSASPPAHDASEVGADAARNVDGGAIADISSLPDRASPLDGDNFVPLDPDANLGDARMAPPADVGLVEPPIDAAHGRADSAMVADQALIDGHIDAVSVHDQAPTEAGAPDASLDGRIVPDPDASGTDFFGQDGRCLVECPAGCRDDDGDLFPEESAPCVLVGAPRFDCNDALNSVNPSAHEVCNGLDDDCDGLTDNGLQLIAEACNGVDDNCDGRVDEVFDLGLRCEAGFGLCMREGQTVCGRDGSMICSAVGRPPPSQTDTTCDGVDEDCDGDTDEDFEGALCGVGACEARETCVDGAQLQCAPRSPLGPDTTCDGVDDDCDDDVDNGLEFEEAGRFQGDVFGGALAGIGVGDLDGDGFDDVAVKGHEPVEQGDPTEVVYLVSGADRSTIRRLHAINESPSRAAFGAQIRPISDVSNDGRPDIAVRSLNRVYVFSGADGSLVWAFPASPPFATPLLGLGILDNIDGLGGPDIAVGESANGNVLVFSGESGAAIGTIDSVRGGNTFGTAIAGIRDSNGDGRGEVAIGDPGQGHAYLFRFVNNDFSLVQTWNGPIADTGFGSDVADVGDVNGDGFTEVGVAGGGQPGYYSTLSGLRVGGPADGAVFRIHVLGNVDRDETPDLLFVLSGVAGTVILPSVRGMQEWRRSSFWAQPAGDFDGDGRADIVANTGANGEFITFYRAVGCR